MPIENFQTIAHHNTVCNLNKQGAYNASFDLHPHRFRGNQKGLNLNYIRQLHRVYFDNTRFQIRIFR